MRTGETVCANDEGLQGATLNLLNYYGAAEGVGGTEASCDEMEVRSPSIIFVQLVSSFVDECVLQGETFLR
jgi:hypothetical protein